MLYVAGFPGRVVLFSGSVAYMDDDNVSACDYVVPLPFMKTDADNLKAWMIAPTPMGGSSSVDKKVTRLLSTSDQHLPIPSNLMHPLSTFYQYTLSIPHTTSALHASFQCIRPVILNALVLNAPTINTRLD